MVRNLSACLACAIAIVCSGCRSGPAIAHEDRALPEPFVDAFLKAEIEEHGGELGMTSKAAASEELAKQLDRTSCSLTLPSALSIPHDLPALYRAAAPGTLVISKIYYCDKCGRWHAPVNATAFAITADGACVTAYHVFRQVEANTVVVVTDAWGHTYPVREVLAASRRDDVAIFRVDASINHLPPLVPLTLRTGLLTGSTVAVLSHPAGHFFSFSPGHVGRRVWRYHGMVGDMKELSQSDAHDEAVDRSDLAKLTQVLEITADYGVGSSGGPVLDECGNVVGVVSNTLPVYVDPKERKTQQMNFHLCVPAESILKLIK